VRRSPDTVPKDHVDANLPDLGSTSKLYRTPWSADLLSWVSVRASRPIDREAHHSPLHRLLATRPLPREELLRASASGSHPRSHVPSSWFHTTSTAFSASQSAGLLHPAAGPGVRGVSAVASPTEGRGRSGFLSAQDSHPSKEPPCDSRTASPRPLPPCRSSPRFPRARPAPLLGRRLHVGWARGVGFEALLHHRVPASVRAIAGAGEPVLPGLRSPSRSFTMAGDPAPTIIIGRHPEGFPPMSSDPHPPLPASGKPPTPPRRGRRGVSASRWPKPAHAPRIGEASTEVSAAGPDAVGIPSTVHRTRRVHRTVGFGRPKPDEPRGAGNAGEPANDRPPVPSKSVQS